MDLVRQAAAVLMVLGLLALFVWRRGRRGAMTLPFSRAARRDRRLMESVDRIALSPAHALHLVRLGDRSLLVAVHTGGCSLLDARPWAELESTAVKGIAP